MLKKLLKNEKVSKIIKYGSKFSKYYVKLFRFLGKRLKIEQKKS